MLEVDKVVWIWKETVLVYHNISRFSEKPGRHLRNFCPELVRYLTTPDCSNERTEGRTDGGTDRRTNERQTERTGGRTDERRDGRTEHQSQLYITFLWYFYVVPDYGFLQKPKHVVRFGQWKISPKIKVVTDDPSVCVPNTKYSTMACTYESVMTEATSKDEACVNENCRHVHTNARALPRKERVSSHKFSITLTTGFVKRKLPAAITQGLRLPKLLPQR
jgi:hypothetical protein